jgi:hypothetical protein
MDVNANVSLNVGPVQVQASASVGAKNEEPQWLKLSKQYAPGVPVDFQVRVSFFLSL